MAAQSRESVLAQRGKRLSEALKGRGLMPELGPEDRLKIIDTLVPLIEGAYCHLPQKRAGYAADPVQALRLLRQQCTELTDGEFHLAVTGIITGLRDAHTRYVGPSGLRDRVAVLPFLVESYGPQEAPRFIVSKVAKATLAPAVTRAGFAEGVELVSWNFVPMARAVDVYALQETGGRRDARRARALETLTFRSLDYGPPPDEYQVSIGFLAGRTLSEVVIPWRVVGIPPATLGRDPVVALRAAWNPCAESVRKAKTLMFAPDTWDASRRKAMGGKTSRGRTSPAKTGPAGTSRTGTPAVSIGTDLETSLPEVLSARTISATFREGRRVKHAEVGYLRIWSFDVHDHEAFVTEVNRLLKLLPQDRLIVDLRGNPGGLIWAAERLLQLFTDKQVEPTRFSLVATPLTRAMAESEFNHLELDAWLDSLTDAVSTGEVYSQPIPLTDPAWCRDIGRSYPGKAVLVVDPNTYSSGDLFAAGWADHEIGPMVSIGEATGAGGANVWGDLQLNDALSGTAYEFDPLPDGVHFTMAIRRAVRSGLSDGVPIEDLGIRGVPYALTRRDLLEGNPDLLGFCAQTLNDWSPMS